MIKYLSLVLVATMLSGCGIIADQRRAMFIGYKESWRSCSQRQADICAEKYDDAEMCADRAIIECNVYKSNISRMMREDELDIATSRTVMRDTEAELRRDIVSRARQTIIDHQRRAGADPPVPMTIR